MPDTVVMNRRQDIRIQNLQLPQVQSTERGKTGTLLLAAITE